jgi:tripartite-type tricarboxylate transporter receptor subunit TctC
MIESGVPGLSLSFWHGLWTTAGTPKTVVDRIVDAVRTALADPSVRQRLDGLGMVIFPRGQQNPEALATYHEAEAAKWWPVINAAGIKASN